MATEMVMPSNQATLPAAKRLTRYQKSYTQSLSSGNDGREKRPLLLSLLSDHIFTSNDRQQGLMVENKTTLAKSKKMEMKKRGRSRETPATTEMSLPRYRSTNKSTVFLNVFGSSNRVVMSWNMIPTNCRCISLKT